MEPKKIHINDVMPGFLRPQESADDLVAEYKAWVAGDLDGHDNAVHRCRDMMLKRSDSAHDFALKFLDPKFVCSDGSCDCRSSEKVSILAQLEGRLAAVRGRRKEYEALEKFLDAKVAGYRQETGCPS